jgi:hypothetical protein
MSVVVMSLCITVGSISYSTSLILFCRSFGGQFSRSVISRVKLLAGRKPGTFGSLLPCRHVC